VRAKRVIGEYPDAAPTAKLLSLLAEALEKQGKKDEALEAEKARDDRFPQQGSGKR
jgi:outer membrane protein assembly factor BamD (BamD/ComL family)